ncbi:serine/threonine-protein kinase [Cellulomonas soli]|nr:Stk1 family PASTA domain-containing Ser/Thr kinase [Cellulomonas soli]NYI58673.1 serine/threonine-protein kinase [Cellulomonas soli]
MDSGSRILAGRYAVGELIGRGGMAEVHIGHDNRLGRTVAIKILRSDLARDPTFQARFRREAQAAASLNHPAIVAVYDTGEDMFTEPSGNVAHVPFIVMEYVEGHTVRGILRDGQAVPIEEAVEITVGVLSALEYSHHAGIVHRDIKPANVMLTPTGAVKVMDFGIARAVADSQAGMTQTQAVIGTAQYLSPEQARGETVDTRSDLYSTGCLLFELLTGRPPFMGDSPVAVAYQHVREAAPTPSSLAPDVPDTLDRITLKALAKDRNDRYSNAAEFRADLEAVLRGGPVSAPAVGAVVAAAALGADATQVMAPTGPATQTLPPSVTPWGTTGVLTTSPDDPDEDEPRKRPWLMWSLIGIAVLAVAGIIAILINMTNDPPEVTTVAVPDVVGMAEADAVTALEDAGLLTKRTTAASTEVAAGNVISTDPPAAAKAEKGSTVTYVVSAGPDSVTVPDVSGKTADEATSILQEKGLVVDPVQEQDNNPDFERGEVTKSEPAAQSPVDAGSTVKLFVSTGNVELGDLSGKTRDDALAELNALKLVGNTTEVDSTEPEGTVVAQDRTGLLQQGTTVNLQIAKAATNPTVPNNLTNMKYDDAVQALAAVGLTSVQRKDLPSDAAKGLVLYTDPAGGSEVERDQTIIIYVSQGPQAGSTPTSNP